MLERELKLDAEPGFVFPDLPGEARLERTFEALYFDTTDARLRVRYFKTAERLNRERDHRRGDKDGSDGTRTRDCHPIEIRE